MKPTLSSLGSLAVRVAQQQLQQPGVAAQVAQRLGVDPSAVSKFVEQLAPSAQVQQSAPVVAPRRASSAEVWNLTTCQLVAQTKTLPPHASRLYAQVSAAQYRAAKATEGQSELEQKVAIAAASAEVLTQAFEASGKLPEGTVGQRVGEQLRELLFSGGAQEQVSQDVLVAAAKVGQDAATEVLARADNHAEAIQPNPELPVEPTKPGVWFSSATPPAPGLLPNWGKLTPWHMPGVGEEGCPSLEPFEFGSEKFREQLAEVVEISNRREADPTCVELEIGRFWADNPGTPTPPGHWNDIAREHIARAGMSEVEAARVLYYLNTAMSDAGVACWDQKYAHQLARPSQVDSAITVPADIGLPNFPSYPSGHASFSGAAAKVCEHFFPGATTRVPYSDEEKSFAQLADEAALSRVYAGIHYMEDGTGGVRLGEAAGQFAVSAAKAEQTPRS